MKTDTVTFKERLLWTLASAALFAITRELVDRLASKAWERGMGHPPPKKVAFATKAGDKAGSGAASFLRGHLPFARA